VAGKSKTYELALKIGGKADSSLKNACMSAEKDLSSLKTSTKAVGKVAAAIGAAAVGAAAAAGTAMYKLGSNFDAAYDTIRIGTGATGADLEALKDNMQAVYQTVPAEMTDTAQAIADYNTRLGVTGSTLETLSTQALQVSDMLGDDLSGVIENSSKAFQQWNVAQQDMAGEMDYVFKVSQSTGAGFTDLMTDMQTYGAQLQDMGYGFEESATLIGQLGKEGVNVTEVLGAMKKSVTTMAKEGVSATEGMEKYYDAIKNAGTATEATQIASEVFGSRAASTMSAAIRSGSMAVDDLTASLQNNGETIAGAASDTYDFSEKWAIFKHKMEVAIEPAATAVFNELGNVFDRISPQIEKMAPQIAQVAGNLAVGIENTVEKSIKAAKWIAKNKTLILSLAAGVGTAVVAFKTLTAASTAVSAVKNLSTVFKKASEGGGVLAKVMGLGGVKMALIAGAIALVAAGFIYLWNNSEKFRKTVMAIWEKLKPLGTSLAALAETAWNNLAPALEFVGTVLVNGLGNAVQVLAPVIQNIIGIFTGLIDFITGVFSGDWGKAWQGICDIFSNLFGGLVNIAKIPINAVVGAINAVIGAINSCGITIPEWVPILGGKKFSISLPEIPMLAAGGIATATTIGMIGEGGEPETVLPLSKLAALLDGWAKPKPTGGGGNAADPDTITLTQVFNFYGATTKEEAQEVGRISFTEFCRLHKQMEMEKRRKSFSPA